MLTGQKPYVADEPLEVLRMHREAPVPRASESADAAARQDVRILDDVIARAMQKNADDRYASATEFAQAIDAALRTASQPVAEPAAAAPAKVPPPMESASEASDGRSVILGERPVVQHRRPRSQRALYIAVAIVSAVALIGVIAMLASAGHHEVAAPRDAAPAVASPAPLDAPDPSDDVVSRARALAADGNAEDAIALLQAARTTFPDRAALPFEQGKLYFARFWWRDGEDAFRAAIRVDASYRANPELIKTVLRGFIMTPDTDDGLARFLLVDVGPDAIPYLQETARSHPSQKVRGRAAALLARYR